MHSQTSLLFVLVALLALLAVSHAASARRPMIEEDSDWAWGSHEGNRGTLEQQLIEEDSEDNSEGI